MLSNSTRTSGNDSPTIGPAKGWLIINGGRGLNQALIDCFVSLAGGPDAQFEVIPTAREDNRIDVDKEAQLFRTTIGVRNVTVLHTRDRNRADTEEFIEPLRTASGVWIDGGRQWRLADAYLGTAVELEIKALLARGGVVAGSSAGATIQGSYLVRGDPAGNTIVMSPGHEVGFGLLSSSAIDQHINERHRESGLDQVILSQPNLLGIGLFANASIIVHCDYFGVVGDQVIIHDGRQHDGGKANYYLSPGQIFDLRKRTVVVAPEPPTPEVGGVPHLQG